MDQVADIWMARVDRQLVAFFDHLAHRVDVGEVQLRMQALVYMFKARVTRSTLPVRSPLPNRQPSTRSAPAIRPSSVAATPVPRSLWVCRLMITLSRLSTWRPNHSIWSA